MAELSADIVAYYKGQHPRGAWFGPGISSQTPAATNSLS